MVMKCEQCGRLVDDKPCPFCQSTRVRELRPGEAVTVEAPPTPPAPVHTAPRPKVYELPASQLESPRGQTTSTRAENAGPQAPPPPQQQQQPPQQQAKQTPAASGALDGTGGAAEAAPGSGIPNDSAGGAAERDSRPR